MAARVQQHPPSGKALKPIPPLVNGDRLTRAEFEQRYNAMPHLNKAELIEGVVDIPGPVGFRRYASPRMKLTTWLGTYHAATPGTSGGLNTSVRLDAENEFQPDPTLIIVPERGGNARISADDFLEGGPELVGEFSASAANIGLTTKIGVYRRNNVREYIVWRVLDEAIDWFVLRQTQYERLATDEAGCYRSDVFPGLWLDAAAMIRFDMPQVLRVLQQGLATAEHAAFVEKLKAHNAK